MRSRLGPAILIAAILALGATPASAATLTELANLDGQILDATPSQVLYWQDRDNHGPLKIRDIASGTDVTVPVPAGREVGSETAALIDGGAMYVSQLQGGNSLSAQMEEWRNGVLTDLGFANSQASLRVAGNYAIWSADAVGAGAPKQLIRRDLTTGTNATVSTDAVNTGSVVLANGDVYYMQASLAQIYKWHAGVSTQVTHGGSGETSTGPQTTGTDVVFRRANRQTDADEVFFSDGTTDSLLPGSGSAFGFSRSGQDYAVAGDWIAYTRADRTQVWTRASDGTLTRVSTDGAAATFASVLGFAPTGQVMYDRQAPGGERTFLGSPGAHPFPVSGMELDAFESGGHWYIVRRSSLLRLETGTAITTSPAAATQAHTADLALASTELNPTFTCTLDGSPEPCDEDNHIAGLAEGTHTFTARTTAPATDPTGDTASWIVDTTPPDDFSLSAPAEGAALSDPTPELSWEAANDSGSGIASYDVTIDGQSAGSTDAATPALTPSAALADGTHSWQVRAIDGAGNTRDSTTSSFTVDTEPPSAPEPGQPTYDEAVPTARPTFTWSPASDGGSGIAGYDVEIDGDSAHVGSGATSFTPSSDLADGEHEWRVVANDAAGNRRGLPVTRFRVDTLPPAAAIDPSGSTPPSVTSAPLPGPPGVSINHGSRVTGNANVTLTLRWPQFATRMLVSNDGGFARARPRPVAAELPWKLASTGRERLPKTVYVRFIGGLAGNETYTDDIVLDETAPRIAAATVRAGSRARHWSIHVRASDRPSGLSAIQVVSGRGASGALIPYARTVVVWSRHTPRSVRVIDRAGNDSKWKRLSRRR